MLNHLYRYAIMFDPAHTTLHPRLTGAEACTATQYYYAASGQRYRSKNEVAKALGIDIPSRAPKAETIGEDGVKVSKVSIFLFDLSFYVPGCS